MNEYETIDRGQQAASLLNHPLIAEAFQILDRKCWDAFKATPARDAEGREYIAKMTKVIADFREHFERIVQDGENAKAAIKDRERRSLIERLRA